MKTRNKNAPGATGADVSISKTNLQGPVVKKSSKYVEAAHCATCGTVFSRGTQQRWKTLCLSCYAWTRAYKAHDEQRRWLQRAR